MDVLLVEDDDGVREIVADLLAGSARVRATHSLLEALQALEAGTFQLVIADLRIRGTADGGRQILSAAHRRLMPVVTMTGLQGNEMRRLLGEQRPDAVLLKPFAIQEALALCDRFARTWQEVARLAGAPREGAWQPISPGVELLVTRGDALSGHRFVRWSAGASCVVHAVRSAQAGQVLEGALGGDGEALTGGRSFFLSAGQSYELGSEHGGVAALVGMTATR